MRPAADVAGLSALEHFATADAIVKRRPQQGDHAITLIVFSGFSIFWLGENLTWHHAIGFALIAIGASFIFRA